MSGKYALADMPWIGTYGGEVISYVYPRPVWRVQPAPLYPVGTVDDGFVYRGQFGFCLSPRLQQEPFQRVSEVKQLSLLLLCELNRLGDLLDCVFGVKHPRREYPVHWPPQNAAGGGLFKHLLQRRRLLEPQREL